MKLKNTVEDQMASPLCFLRNPLPWIAGLVPLLIFSGLLGFGFLSIVLTSTVLILSTIYFSFSKQKPVYKPVLVEELVEQEVLSSPHMEDVASKLESVNETIEKEAEEDEGMSQIQGYIVRAVDSLSESEYLGHSSSTSEDSEVDWPFHDNADRSLDCSDGSISDEESLIEIALPSGQYVGPKEERPKINLQQKLTDFSQKSLFHQHSLMELLAAEINEINEEENLIEIDISMGSIKCSRFEIEA